MAKQTSLDPGYDAYAENKREFVRLGDALKKDHELVKVNGEFLKKYSDLNRDFVDRCKNLPLSQELSDEAIVQAREIVDAIKRIPKNIEKREELRSEIESYEIRTNGGKPVALSETDEKSREVFGNQEEEFGADERI